MDARQKKMQNGSNRNNCNKTCDDESPPAMGQCLRFILLQWRTQIPNTESDSPMTSCQHSSTLRREMCFLSSREQT